MPRWILFTLASVIMSLAGTYLVKRWIVNQQPLLFWSGLALYTISSVTWIWALKFERIAVAEALWSSAILILTIAMGLLVFHERIGVQETVGLILAVVAALLLTVKF